MIPLNLYLNSTEGGVAATVSKKKPSTQAYRMTFVPSASTKYAWDNRPFNYINKLEDLLHQVESLERERRVPLRGHVTFKGVDETDCKSIWPDSYLTGPGELNVPFSSRYILKEIIDKYDSMQGITVATVAFYREGYFIC